MADKITYTDILTLGYKRPDASIQKINLSNPQDTLTAEVIRQQMTNAMNYEIFVDSKNPSNIINSIGGYSVGTAYRTRTTIRELDLEE